EDNVAELNFLFTKFQPPYSGTILNTILTLAATFRLYRKLRSFVNAVLARGSQPRRTNKYVENHEPKRFRECAPVAKLTTMRQRNLRWDLMRRVVLLS